jgi:tryptophan halogenase
VYHLLEHFPDRGLAPGNIAAYNAAIAEEIERIRDFIILHYCLTERDDTTFWRDCRAMEVPASLAERIELYRETGRIRPRAGELFTDLSWFYVLEGMGVRPRRHDPLIDIVPAPQLDEILRRLATETADAARGARAHDEYFDAAVPRAAEAVR